jgi:serine O-acetyltransferase
VTRIDREEDFIQKLFKLREPPCCVLPDKGEVENFAGELLALLFPHFSKKVIYTAEDIEVELELLKRNLYHILKPLEKALPEKGRELAGQFFATIPAVHEMLILDATAITEGDPAARNMDEVILTYPGFFAIAIYRIAHEFHKAGVPFFPRVLTEFAHRLTGIDINPGAQIGRSFCIDHGTGIVIGETTAIGDNVKIYQGVTLGALSVKKQLANIKRHPTIGDNCVIYSGATILGGETIIGNDSIIGGNVWLTNGVPPFSVVYQTSQVKVRSLEDTSQAEINFVI